MNAAVTTLAGSGLFDPNNLAVDASENVFVADTLNHRIRKITSTGVFSTFAGDGPSHPSSGGSTDGTGTNARFNFPYGITVDLYSGNIYVADTDNHRIRQITAFGVVTTLAGSSIGFSDGTGTNAKFSSPYSVTVDSSGNLYVTDQQNNRIRKISAGVVTTLAGSGTVGYVDGTGTNARLEYPTGITADSSGNIIVSERSRHRIRKISPSGVVTTLAGSTQGYVDGTSAKFYWPDGLTADKAGNVYVADRANYKIRMITSTGLVTTIAGTTIGYLDGSATNAKFSDPAGVALNSKGDVLYVSEVGTEKVRKITFTPSVPGPLPVCDSTWHHIALTYSGSSSTKNLTAYIDGSTYASTTSSTYAISGLSSSTLRIGWNGLTPVGTAGELFSGSMSDLRIFSRSLSSTEIVTLSRPLPSSTPSPSPTAPHSPTISVTNTPTISVSSSPTVSVLCLANTYTYIPGSSLCSSCPSGSTLVSSSLGCRPSLPSNAGPIDTSFYLSGSQTEGVSAFLNIVVPSGLTYYSCASSFPTAALVVASGSYISNPLLSSLPTGTSAFTVSSWVQCNASSLTDANPSDVVLAWGDSQSSTNTSLTAATLAVTSKERMKQIATVSTLAGSGTAGLVNGVGTNARFNNPYGVAVDSLGNIYVADQSNHCIRRISPSGDVTTIAGSGSAGFSDGTGTNARFYNPTHVALTSSGTTLYVSEQSANHRIRKITLSSGIVSTLAGSTPRGRIDGTGTNAKFFDPFGIDVDVSGNVYVADTFNDLVRKVTSSGVVTTIAGSSQGFADGTGTNAKFFNPLGVAVDSTSGNIFVADPGNVRIRKISSSGVVSTLAGNGTTGYADGLGTNAMFSLPLKVAVDASGNIYLADGVNHRIRKITSSGFVTTLTGSGSAGYVDAIGTNAKFNFRYGGGGIAFDAISGSMYVADTNNHRIRKVSVSFSQTPSLPGPLPVCDSTWHHIALTYSGSSSTNNLTAFIDGLSVATTTSATFAISSSSSSSFRLGWNGINTTAGEFFSGSMSDIRVFHRSLSSTEVKSLSEIPNTNTVQTLTDGIPFAGSGTSYLQNDYYIYNATFHSATASTPAVRIARISIANFVGSTTLVATIGPVAIVGKPTLSSYDYISSRFSGQNEIAIRYNDSASMQTWCGSPLSSNIPCQINIGVVTATSRSSYTVTAASGSFYKLRNNYPYTDFVGTQDLTSYSFLIPRTDASVSFHLTAESGVVYFLVGSDTANMTYPRPGNASTYFFQSALSPIGGNTVQVTVNPGRFGFCSTPPCNYYITVCGNNFVGGSYVIEARQSGTSGNQLLFLNVPTADTIGPSSTGAGPPNGGANYNTYFLGFPQANNGANPSQSVTIVLDSQPTANPMMIATVSSVGPTWPALSPYAGFPNNPNYYYAPAIVSGSATTQQIISSTDSQFLSSSTCAESVALRPYNMSCYVIIWIIPDPTLQSNIIITPFVNVSASAATISARPSPSTTMNASASSSAISSSSSLSSSSATASAPSSATTSSSSLSSSSATASASSSATESPSSLSSFSATASASVSRNPTVRTIAVIQDVQTASSSESNSSLWIIIGGSILGVIVSACFGYACGRFQRKQTTSDKEDDQSTNNNISPIQVDVSIRFHPEIAKENPMRNMKKHPSVTVQSVVMDRHPSVMKLSDFLNSDDTPRQNRKQKKVKAAFVATPIDSDRTSY
jgi:sugar lactone lactonase YvrE